MIASLEANNVSDYAIEMHTLAAIQFFCILSSYPDGNLFFFFFFFSSYIHVVLFTYHLNYNGPLSWFSHSQILSA